MFKKFFSQSILGRGLVGLLLATTAVLPASAQNLVHEQAMEADGFSLWNSGERGGVAFDVYNRSASAGGGYYYFLWSGNYGAVADHSDPEVVVFFQSNIARVTEPMLTDCYNANQNDDQCLEPDRKPTHFRHVGPCAFPWQTAIDGSTCGGRAAIARPGGF